MNKIILLEVNSKHLTHNNRQNTTIKYQDMNQSGTIDITNLNGILSDRKIIILRKKYFKYRTKPGVVCLYALVSD